MIPRFRAIKTFRSSPSAKLVETGMVGIKEREKERDKVKKCVGVNSSKGEGSGIHE